MKHYELTNTHDYIYNLTIRGENVIPLYRAIKQILKTARYDSETNSLFFSAEHVLSFKEHLFKQNKQHQHYKTSLKMIDDLSRQMLSLKEQGYSFYGFDIQDIVTIDDHFIFCSTQHLLPLTEEENILFYVPFNKPYFANPELYELTSLPTEISYKCVYYSLGVLTTFYVLNNYLLVANEVKSQEEIESVLKPIYNTKLYWFIKRCLTDNVNERVLLLI
jgi:hypothetical protein